MINKSNVTIEAFHNAFISPSKKETNGRRRKDHMKYVLENFELIDGDILEFGVFNGKSINIISNYFPDQTVYGFDSFEGLPEDWVTNPGPIKHTKGYFAVDKLPEVNPNVKLIKGFFDITLEKWIEEYSLEQVKFLHIDSDLYSSANYILTVLNDYIKPGTIIVFDELYPWSNEDAYLYWMEGEWKALVEWINTYNREFEVLCRNEHQQATVKIIK